MGLQMWPLWGLDGTIAPSPISGLAGCGVIGAAGVIPPATPDRDQLVLTRFSPPNQGVAPGGTELRNSIACFCSKVKHFAHFCGKQDFWAGG